MLLQQLTRLSHEAGGAVVTRPGLWLEGLLLRWLALVAGRLVPGYAGRPVSLSMWPLHRAIEYPWEMQPGTEGPSRRPASEEVYCHLY